MISIEPQISIIVPIYKVEDYLSQCIESILAQCFRDYELILVDDGSPDTCPEICDRYAQKDNRIRVIHQKNSGLSVARNTGIEMSKGEYLCFIDSDDLLSPEYCSLLYHAVVDTGCKVAACRMERFTEEVFSPHGVSNSCDVDAMSYTEFLKKQMSREIEIGVCNKLFHRSVFERIRFMPNKLHEDIIFAGDLLSKDNCDVVYIDTPLYFYRQRANSIINQQANETKCNPDRVFAGNYLLECAKKTDFAYIENCLAYAAQYPWCFVDSIYVHFRFRENMKFLNALQIMIRSNRQLYRELSLLGNIQRKRMLLFARSKILYGFNAYARLLRVYLFHVLKLDAYADGHGI